jgi:hypothetical protein
MEAELKKSLDIERELAAQMNHHPKKQLKEKKKAKKGDITAKSHSSSVLELHNKLNEVESPSSSKPDDDEVYGPEMDEEQLADEVSQSMDSNTSIPMAHREYEKILRQLEAECRTHIKCEQQMKLHIECL